MIPKFRAWDKENDRMIYPSTTGVCFEMNDDGISVLDIDVDYPNDYGFPKIASILMQSTGLKDKNGVEIYDGDYLHRRVHVILLGTDLNEWVDEYVHVEWKYGGWHVGEDLLEFVLEEGIDHHTGCKQTALEVVGNIYENPELLEEQR